MVIIGIVTTVNSTLGSALPSGATTYIAVYFNITIQAQLVLPISVYLIGYVLGPLAFGPLTETYGRRFITLLTFFGFTIFTMACALAPSWPSFLVFRLFTGICASSPTSVTGGIYADIYNNPISRGRAMAWFMVVSGAFGPNVSVAKRGLLGNYVRPSTSSSNLRFRLGHQLAMVVLGVLDVCWCLMHPGYILA